MGCLKNKQNFFIYINRIKGYEILYIYYFMLIHKTKIKTTKKIIYTSL